MEALVKRRTDVRLRLVDIGAWDSPVAAQYGVRSLPTLWTFADGEQVASDTEGSIAVLNALR